MLTVEVSPEDGGTVDINQVPVVSFPYESEIAADTVISLKAVTSPGYAFSGWEGDLDGAENPVEITMSSDKIIRARFSKIIHTLSIDVDGSGTTVPSPGDYDLEEGLPMQVGAVPKTGWEFVKWTGDIPESESRSIKLVLDTDKTVTAHFIQVQHTLAITQNGNGLVAPASGIYAYNEGDSVDIKAVAETGWQFDGWTGVTGITGDNFTLTMDSDKEITANFSKIPVKWGLIGGIIGGVLVIAAGVYFAVRPR